MSNEKAIEIVKTHQAWRRGEDERHLDELGYNATELGIALDILIELASEVML